MMKKLNLAILASGRGSNFQAIHRSIQQKKLSAHISLVLSDQPSAGALVYASEQGMAHQVVAKQKGEARQSFDERLLKILRDSPVDIVVLAGYMRILTPVFLEAFPERVVNIHPSLLPAFPGLHAQRQALEAGVRFSGCTVHFVDENCDTGPIIDQRVVPVLAEDDEASLSERILVQEHQLYSDCLQKIAEGRVKIQGRKVLIQG